MLLAGSRYFHPLSPIHLLNWNRGLPMVTVVLELPRSGAVVIRDREARGGWIDVPGDPADEPEPRAARASSLLGN